MLRDIETFNKVGEDIAGNDSFFFSDLSQNLAAIHVGFIKNGRTITKTLSIDQCVNDPKIKEVLTSLKNSLESYKSN
jgi:hypothetical protein